MSAGLLVTLRPGRSEALKAARKFAADEAQQKRLTRTVCSIALGGKVAEGGRARPAKGREGMLGERGT